MSNMTMDQAKKILESKHSDLLTKSGVDYDKYFVFNTVPKQHDEQKDGIWLNGLLAVDKETEKIIGFNPIAFKDYFAVAKKHTVTFKNTGQMPEQSPFSNQGKSFIDAFLKKNKRLK